MLDIGIIRAQLSQIKPSASQSKRNFNSNDRHWQGNLPWMMIPLVLRFLAEAHMRFFFGLAIASVQSAWGRNDLLLVKPLDDEKQTPLFSVYEIASESTQKSMEKAFMPAYIGNIRKLTEAIENMWKNIEIFSHGKGSCRFGCVFQSSFPISMNSQCFPLTQRRIRRR